MCDRLQKSVIESARYGASKFFGKTKPSISARPIAMSEEPEKSQYSWKAYAARPYQASYQGRTPAPKAASATYPMGFARRTFLAMPSDRKATPRANFSTVYVRE